MEEINNTSKGIEQRKTDFGVLTEEARRKHISDIFSQHKLGIISQEQAVDLVMDIANDLRVRESMTNLYDKNGLMLRLNEYIRIAEEQNQPLSVLYADGDRFKQINDLISHQTGDKVIVAMAEALTACTRDYDAVARLNQTDLESNHQGNVQLLESRPGGDEFVVLMLGVDLTTAEQVGQRIQGLVASAVKSKLPELEKKLSHPFSISFGIAEYDPTKDTAETVLTRADQALHESKASRNLARV